MKQACMFLLLIVGTLSTICAQSIQTLDSVKKRSERDILLQEIVVQHGKEKQLMETAGAISQLTRVGLDARDPYSINTYLNTIPGVYAHNGTLNTNRIVIRGIGSRTPFSTNRIRAYYEEIPLTDGEGTSLIEDIDQNSIGSIAVIKGTSSSIYGAGLGGSITINAPAVTASGLSGYISSSVGSFNTLSLTGGLSYLQDQKTMLVRIAHLKSDSYRDNNNYERFNGLFLGKTEKGKSKITLLANYIHLNAQIPSSLSLADYNNQPAIAAANWAAVRGFETYDRLLIGSSLQYNVNSQWQFKNVVYGSIFDQYESRPFNILDDQSFTLGTRNFISYTTRQWFFKSGFELFSENYKQQTFDTNEGLQGDIINDQHQDRRFLNGFLYTDFQASAKLRLESGMNINLLSYNLEDRFFNDSLSGSYQYPLIVSPRLGLNYQLYTDTYFYMSVGHGFSAPSVEETLFPGGRINPNIKPEQGFTLDIGFRSNLVQDKLQLDISFYAMRINDLLVSERISESENIGINAGQTRHEGLEIMLAYSTDIKGPPHHISTTLSGALMRQRFSKFIDSGEDFTGNALPGIPNVTLNYAANWNYKETVGLNLNMSYAGNQYLRDDNVLEQPGYFLMHIKSWWNLRKKLSRFKINAGINNLLDKRYAAMVLVNAGSFGGRAPRYFYPGVPRNVYAGVKVDF